MKTKKLLLILTAILLLHLYSNSQVLEQDSLALVAFYNSTGGPNWKNNSNWLTGPVSTWYGVTVQGERVIELTLYQNNLNGTIPTEIGNLTQIEKFKLGHDENLTGEIPESIGNLQQLEIFVICNCAMTGTITNNICNCANLSNLSLWENNLSGPIPPEIGNLDSLKFLDLHDNQLIGPIPPELGNLENLEELRLNSNQLTGTIPEEVTLLDNLQIFNLSSNQLSGKLPEYLSNLFYQNTPLTIDLDVSHNRFKGAVPNSWGNLSFLIDGLNLSYNNFTSLPQVNYNWCMTFFEIEGNKLTFEHIESHYQSYQQGLYYFFYYYPQDYMMKEIDTALVPGSSYSIYSGTGGEFTNYKWYRNGEMILESPDADTLHLFDISYADTGIYTCKTENSLIYFLRLYRNPVHISLDTNGSYISDKTYQINTLQTYPNPANKKITVLFPFKSEPVSLRIFNMEGKCVFKREQIPVNNSKITAGIKGLKPGIYLLRIQTEKNNYSTKIIINKRETNR